MSGTATTRSPVLRRRQHEDRSLDPAPRLPEPIPKHRRGKASALERFHGHILTMDARIEKDAREHHVELVANLGKNHTLVANVRREAFGEALSEAVDRMGRQLRKHHDKARLEPRRHGASA
ncbi:MAG: HPF/RaiA family ribosome-associated protein [Planctomycetota bacterium]